METFATSGFELGALLAPELAGAAASASQGLQGDPRAPEPGADPFAFALMAAATIEPEAATLPASGKTLPLFDRALSVAQVVESAPVLPVHDPVPLPSVTPESKGAVISDPSTPLLTAVTARDASTPIATTGDAAGFPKATSPVSADPSGSNAAPATVALDANAAKLASAAQEHAADVIRLVTKQVEARAPEPAGVSSANDAPAQGTGERAPGRGAVVLDALKPLVPEPSRQAPNAMVIDESANVSAAIPIARNLHRLEGGARASETGAPAPGVAAIVTEANAVQSVDAPKITAELPAGNEARLPGALAERLHWMIDQNLGEARIKLNPPQLGAIDIKITMADDQTFVQFTASQAGAREILESALPRLRDLLGAAGLELGGATVGGEATNREQPEVRWGTLPDLEPLDVIEPVLRASRPADGRIDIYA
ncbi:MAG: hypothetical protein HKN84_14290 [Gammaproteobacteria bacterium]|nr:hypothetical protein [Gammaproteobacteria bacterium]